MLFEYSSLLGSSEIAVFAISAVVCGAIIGVHSLLQSFLPDRDDLVAVQSAHVRHTPRIGGVAIVIAIVAMSMIAPPEVRGEFLLFSVSLLPVFAAGLLEDIGYRIRPALRLFAAAASSVTAVLVLQLWITHLDAPGLDAALAYAPVAIVFTIFATSGVCNAFNLIDGVNGLAGGAGAIAALGLASIAALSGHTGLTEFNLLIVGALAGFLIFNFPWGRIFLGDAGAYSLGHVLAWSAIVLIAAEPRVSPWAILLLFFWPVADTLFAIYRRRRAGRPTDKPDRLHYHQLVMRALEIMVFGRKRRRITNPLTTVVMMPLVAAPAIAGVAFWDNSGAAFACVVLFAALFVASYRVGLLAASRHKSRRGRPGLRIAGPAAHPGE